MVVQSSMNTPMEASVPPLQSDTQMTNAITAARLLASPSKFMHSISVCVSIYTCIQIIICIYTYVYRCVEVMRKMSRKIAAFWRLQETIAAS